MEIRIENLSKNFKNVKAVENLNVKIHDGELVTFLGPSGCGKSTTLFMLAGLYELDSGKIFFNDLLINDIPTEKRNIGMVFQNYALYPHMTVFKNILFPLQMQRVPKKESLRRCEELMELLQISELKNRKPSQLSGGQQQRVAIARALIKKPEVLLMDEPLSNLDAKLRIEMREEIRNLQEHLGITTIFVTHDQDEATSISDKIIIMNKGQLQQFDNPREIYNNPDNLFTAKFMGNVPMNIFKLNRDGKDFITNANRIEVKKNIFLNNIDRDEIIMAIRPEDFTICLREEGLLSAKVGQIEMKGKDNLVICTIQDEKYRCFCRDDEIPKVGEIIGLKIKEEKAFLFDIDTEEKIF